MSPVYGNNTCSPWAPRDEPCNVGAYVPYAVHVHGVEDVQTSIRFVKDRNIRLVIRNTGHDYLGKSSGAGSLALWTHHLKSLKLLNWSDSTYNGPAIRLGAGVQGFELLAFASRHGLTAVTGDCPSVGIAGGYIQGGGHSHLASRFGLAADQTLEFEVVDASGAYRIVNRQLDAELFWALSGGGAGTFAAVISVTVRAYSDSPTATANLAFDMAAVDEGRFRRGVGAFQAYLPTLHHSGCSASYFFHRDSFSMPLLVCYGLSSDVLERLLVPIKATLESLGIEPHSSVSSVDKYSEGSRTGWGGVYEYAVGLQHAATWLVPRSVVLDPEKNAGIVDAVLKTQGLGGQAGMQTFSPGRDVAPAVDNAAFPGWRDAVLLVWVIIPTNASFPMTRQVKDQKKLSAVLMPIFQSVSPDSGTYLNEADPRDPEWKRNSYGVNYNKLLEIKRRYDPDVLFYAHHAIGGDGWVQKQDGRLCKVADEWLSTVDEL